MNSEPPSEKPSFWSTLPGIFTALGSFIVALTGLLTLLITHFSQAPPTSALTPTPTPTPASTSTIRATPTPTPPSPSPKPKEIVLQGIDLEVSAKDPNKKIEDDVVFSVIKGVDTLETRAISANTHPWKKTQRISFTFRPPIHVYDIDSLRLRVSKNPHFGQDLVLTMAIAGRMSDGSTPILLPSKQFDLGLGNHPDHKPSQEFNLNRPLQ